MTTAQQMRRNAENCLDQAAEAASLPERLRYLRMAHAWESLAECQSWLDTTGARDSILAAIRQH